MNSFPDAQYLKNISVEDIRTYLLQKGWQQMRYTDSRLQVFVNRQVEGEPVLLTLPVDSKLTDFLPLLAEAVSVLSYVEQLPSFVLLQQISVVADDVIHLRLMFPANQNPSIDLTVRFLQSFRDLVVDTANMERVGKDRFFAHSPNQGKQEAQNLQFCHTSPGSFGFSLASPIADEFFAEELPPINRRVVERITRGFHSVHQAEKEQNVSHITDQYRDGMNANMCFAASEMLGSLQGTQLEYSVAWSPKLQAPEDIATFDPLPLGNNSARYLKEAGDYLKATAEAGTRDLGERDIHGTVKELIRSKEGDTNNRSILIESYHHPQNIQASLSEDDYRKACNANRDQRPITIRGRLLSKRRGYWRLLDARDLILR